VFIGRDRAGDKSGTAVNADKALKNHPSLLESRLPHQLYEAEAAMPS
jgi:hypothetical protein